MIDIEELLTEEQSSDILTLSRRWTTAHPGDRSWIVELIRGNLWMMLGSKASPGEKKEAIDEFIENLSVPGQVPVMAISENHKRGVGDRIERLSMKTDGGLSRAAFHLAFADSQEDIREILTILDEQKKAKSDWSHEPTKEMEEWVAIYGMEYLPYDRLQSFAHDRGWTLDEPIFRLAYKSFGSWGNGMIVAVLQDGGLFFYVYKDVDPHAPYDQDDFHEIYYKAPDILVSN